MADIRIHDLPAFPAINKTYGVPVSKSGVATDYLLLLNDLYQSLTFDPLTGDLVLSDGNTVNIASNSVPANLVSGFIISFQDKGRLNISRGIAKNNNAAIFTQTADWQKTTGSWAAGSGSGGLDTGTIAENSTYYVHAIYDALAAKTDILYSLSETSPTLPGSFTEFLCIGSFVTEFNIDSIYRKSVFPYFYYKYFGVDGLPLPEYY